MASLFGIRSMRMSFAESHRLSFDYVRGRRAAGLHDQVRQREVPLSAGEGVGQLLPAAVLDPPPDGRVAEEELDLAELLELGHRRVDAHELDCEPVFLQEVAHRVLVECKSRTSPRLLPVVSMVCREDEST